MKHKILTVLLLQCIGIVFLHANNISNINHNSNENKFSSPIIIENQSWVASRVLKENELRDIINKYPNLRIIKYDQFYGALIEYNHLDKSTLEQLEYLKQESGIFRIFNKVQEQKNSFELYTPQ